MLIRIVATRMPTVVTCMQIGDLAKLSTQASIPFDGKSLQIYNEFVLTISAK